MAFAAHKIFCVRFVDKVDVSSRLDPENDILDGMAAATGRKGKGDLAVASPARFAAFHFCHGYGALMFSRVDFIMTNIAVIVDGRSLQMRIMAEDDYPSVTGVEDDIKSIPCKNGSI